MSVRSIAIGLLAPSRLSLVVATTAFLTACAAPAAPAATSAGTATDEPSSPSSAASAAAASPEPAAIVGMWHRAQSCDEMLAAFTGADLATSHIDWLRGNFFTEPLPPPDNAPCDGALGPLEHSHYFTKTGDFGSHNQIGESVDDGDFQVIDEDTLSFPSHAREFGFDGELLVDYAVDGDVATFDVTMPESCDNACQDAYAWALSAFASGSWEKGSVPRCPNPDGGSSNRCLGELQAGSYPTSIFTRAIRYAVPDGWTNLEDMPGNFLLIPPGGSLDGIASGSSDYVAVYAGVAIADASCEEVPAANVSQAAGAMAEAIATRPGLVVSEPQPVTVDGLHGLMVDVDLAPDWTGSCPYAQGTPVVPMIIGSGPAGLHHVQNDVASTRLYFLDSQPTNVVIEVNDAPGDTGRTDYESIISQFEFAAPG